jgi:uncharacterized protein
VTPTIDQRIAEELGVGAHQVSAAVEMLDAGSTVPFIARYRKEATGALDDAQLRALEERLRYLRELAERRSAILESIRSQGKLDDELEARINAADSKARLEDIYLPYKPKRRTKAQIAREAGLEPLAEGLIEDPNQDPQEVAAAYVDADKGVADTKAALDGARAILVERFAEDADLTGTLRERLWEKGRLGSTVREGKEEAGAKFADYFDFSEPLTALPSHRVLAMYRGEKEEVLTLNLEPEETPEAGADGTLPRSTYENAIASHFEIVDRGRPADRWLQDTVRWAWRTRILVRLDIDVRMRLWQQAEDDGVNVFAANLREELLVSSDEVRARLGDGSTVMLDGRPEAQFTGREKSPMARLFGRLPGATHLDQSVFFDPETGRLLPQEAAAALIPADANDPDVEIVSYCNTGHWASMNWFVLSEVLGYSNVTLFDDSMVGWTENPENPIESDRSRLDDLRDWWQNISG